MIVINHDIRVYYSCSLFTPILWIVGYVLTLCQFISVVSMLSANCIELLCGIMAFYAMLSRNKSVINIDIVIYNVEGKGRRGYAMWKGKGEGEEGEGAPHLTLSHIRLN